MISLRLLGPADVVLIDGDDAPGVEVPPELLWRKNLGLLAYLASAPDRRVGRERLTGLFWGEKPEEAARHSLAEALRVIRRHVDDAVQDAGSGYVRLAPDAVRTDTEAFEARVAAGDPAGAAGLVAGDFMEGFALPDAWEFEEWLAGQRQAWRSRSVETLVAAAEKELGEGDPDAGHAWARRALELEPSSEAACRIGMKALALRGDRALALTLYEAFGSRLEASLGIEPSEETAALAERVARQRSWGPPSGRSVRPPRGAETRRAPLVGRARELDALVREWESCRAGGEARAALVTGDPGTGRSRLLRELLDRVELDGGRSALVRALPVDREEEGAVLAALGHPLGLDRVPGGTGFADAARDAADGALVLAVDDADWADDASLEALAALPARAKQTPVLLVLASRRAAGRTVLDRLSASVGRDVPGTTLRLDPLGPDALRELAAWAAPDYEPEDVDRLARRLAVDTAGYPLLAVELLHAVAHGLSLGDEEPRWPAPGRTLDQTRPGDVPETLAAAVRVGFRVLSADAQKALAAAAVLDPPVRPDALADATGLAPENLDAALDELEWERWLTADARGYAFHARLVREIVARDMLTPGQRSRIESRV